MGGIVCLYSVTLTKPVSSVQSHAWQQVILDALHGTPVVVDRSQKPRALNAGIEWSVTHTRHLWLMGTYSHPIGIDAEPCDRMISDAVLYRGYPPDSHRPTIVNRVRYWTQFEAQAKLSGQGIRFPIPTDFCADLKTVSWQSHWVTVAAVQPFAGVKVAAIGYPQNGSEWHDGTWRWLEPSASMA
jgi:hypothetical protein